MFNLFQKDNFKKESKKASRSIIFYTIVLLLAIYVCFANGLSKNTLFLLGAFLLILVFNIRKRTNAIKNQSLEFPTEYLEEMQTDDENIEETENETLLDDGIVDIFGDGDEE